jgi:hypothetical protein
LKSLNKTIVKKTQVLTEIYKLYHLEECSFSMNEFMGEVLQIAITLYLKIRSKENK